MKQKIISVVGPTASGKTGLAVNIASLYGGEILSADSMQIYREMSVGTAKPSMEERAGIPHHLMGHISVEQTYSVASYLNDANAVLNDLNERKILPVICGGTGLYIDHLLNDTHFYDADSTEEIRLKYQRIAEQKGVGFIYSRLESCDPVLAAKLHPNDLKRVIRGLEVYESTGRPLSELQEESLRDSPYDVLWIGLNFRNRQLLYDRINRRVDLMVENGLLNEIDYLMRNFQLSATARAAIGYKEIMDAIEASESIDEALELVKQKSRNYAKRQLTWFGKNRDIHWIFCDEMNENERMNEVKRLVDQHWKGEVG